MRKLLLPLLLIVQFANSAPGILDYFTKGKDQNGKVKFTTDKITGRKEQLEELKTDLELLKEQEKEKSETIQTAIDQTNEQITKIKNELPKASENDADFLNKQLAILNETYQTLFNIQLSMKEEISIIEQHIKLLEEYLKDPEFESLKLKPHAFYTFEDFQVINKKILAQQDRLKLLKEQKAEATLELENRSRKFAAIKREYKDKEKEQKEFSKSTAPEAHEILSFRQQGTLIDLEEKYLLHEKELADQRISEINRKVALLESNISIENEKLKLLQADLSRVRNALRVDQKDLKEAESQLNKIKNNSTARRYKLQQEIKELTQQKDRLLNEFETLKKKYETELANIDLDWSESPKSINGFIALCELGYKNEQIKLIETLIDYKRAEIDLENATYRQEEIKYEILQSWYNITKGKFKNQEEINSELKHFQGLLTENKRQESVIIDKRNNVSGILNVKNKALTNLKLIINELKSKKNTIFRQQPNYNFCLTRLAQTYSLIEDQILSTNSLYKVYTNFIGIITSTSQDLTGIISELEKSTIWQRSEYAISWNGIKNIPSDIKHFFEAIYNLGVSFIAGLGIESLVLKVKDLFQTPFDILIWIIRIFLMIGLYFLGRRSLKILVEQFKNGESKNKFIVMIRYTIAGILEFISRHFISIFIWIILLLLVYFEFITDLFLHVCFFIGSIFYLIYLSNRFLSFIIGFNKNHQYPIFSSGFEKRFAFVFSIFAYLTIILLLLREAFTIATYRTSELPKILLATYSILVRILLIFSIGKDEILSLIPSKGAFWNWLSESIDRYYWPILFFIIGLMIMSDPYVGGYGNLVSYFFWGLIGSAVLIKLLLLAQNYIRKTSSSIFFYSEDDTLKERFPYARTWFGLFVITLFILFVLLGIVIGFRIWGKPITFTDVLGVFNTQLFEIDKKPVTPLTILGIIAFIGIGFFVSFAINKFVVRRIFRLIPVDIGMQNTTTTLIRYLIIFSSIFLGFYWGNLSTLMYTVLASIAFIAYTYKDVIGDFISYFIILVQRPIKIGDYIVVDSNTSGFVRQITPRAVILRSKNSFSILVPNSVIISHNIRNWNYSGVFIALDDIKLTISYNVDPRRIKEIIAHVLEQNIEILKTPKPIIRLDEFGDSGYVFTVRAYVSSTKILELWNIASDVRLALVEALQHEKISLAYPTRVIFQKPFEKEEDIKRDKQ